ncbi:MAG: flippase-like domain-containing protein [Phycisphaerae bacterium]|nr:flippase-like domain-containing protein [Phycisphaerae bacterium]
MKRGSRTRLIIQVSLSAILVCFLISRLDLGDFANTIRTVDGLVFVGLCVLLVPGFLVRGYRWKLIFDDGPEKVSLWDSLWLLMVGLGLNLFLPASSGDIAKSFFAYKWSGVKERMLSTSLFDKIIALGSVAIIGVPAALYRGQFRYAGLSLVLMAVMIVMILTPLLAVKIPGVNKSLEKMTHMARGKLNFLDVIKALGVSPRVVLYAIALSVAGWLITYAQFYLAFKCVNAPVDVLYVFTVAPFITLARLFPFTLNGLGTDEMVICYFFKQAGLELETIIAAAIMFRLVTILAPGFLGLFILSAKKKMNIDLHHEEHEEERKEKQ